MAPTPHGSALAATIGLAVLCLCGTPLAAQRPVISTTVDSGTIVRAHLADDEVTGRVLRGFWPISDSLVLCRYPGNPCTATDSLGRVAIASARLVRLDRRVGTRAGRGAMIGGAIGVALGGMLATFYDANCESSDCRRTGTVTFALLTLVGAVLGAGFGSGTVLWTPVR